MNSFNGVGRLTRDVDLRYTQSGKAVGNFSLAINRQFKNQQTGEYDADFPNMVAWGAQAENLANYMKKGDRIGVTGRIQTRSYDDNDGKKIYVTEVVAESIQFLESKNTNQNNQSSNQQNSQPSNQFANNGQPLDIQDDDLPF